ncbi:anti-sigma28 factor (negative regulator of flagellin synthesis) [Algoriphagus iocasae]|uniref:Anti-sigma28 factor (Negative regulator of flagellin synthesis) n=1 Tax=Algoriphagus iocasae TaxID=1836499 RepID=A0A841MXW1_9BACT|nr:hypothetical protein [Algoriphagus iocasae]MBB6328876.1 anti-sigma28 factor (negative regulator of flagellin synthesis) [Algoriphagus iocasae]
MKKITIKNLIEFRRKSDRSKLTFLNNLRKEKAKKGDDSGGDYWVSCNSAVLNSFKTGRKELLQVKIEELKEMILSTSYDNTKKRFQRNIDVLVGFQDFDLDAIKPKGPLEFLHQKKVNSILTIGGLPIEAKPNHVFSFTDGISEEIGAVWFVTKLNGYDRNELGMFAETIFRYLKQHYSQDFFINKDYCVVVDVITGRVVKYSEMESGIVSALLDDTIAQLGKL